VKTAQTLKTLEGVEMTKGNEPAFPVFEESTEFNEFTGQYEDGPLYPKRGLAKRELFAAMAMQAAISCKETQSEPHDSMRQHQRDVSTYAVGMADALLAELERRDSEKKK
jgi:hypothetical protein